MLEHTLNTDEVIAGITFGIEGRRFKGMPLPTMPPNDDAKKNAWTGYVDLSYEIKDGGGNLVTSDANPDLPGPQDAASVTEEAQGEGA